MATDAHRHSLNDRATDAKGRYVLYWMHRAQRADYNAALERAIDLADEHSVAVLAMIVLPDQSPASLERHLCFMLEGLNETGAKLADLGVKLIARHGEPDDCVSDLAAEAVAVVCDGGYLRDERAARSSVASSADCLVEFVETEAVVPVRSVSDKREYAARTIRGKINSRRDDFLGISRHKAPGKSSLRLRTKSDLDFTDVPAALKSLDVDTSVPAVRRFSGGTSVARKRLTGFLRRHLPGYAEARLDPSKPRASELSPYLAFGQISPVEVAVKVMRSKSASNPDKEAFLEELIVRRELGFNYAHFEPNYDTYAALPDWARKTLAEHKDDDRETIWTRAELERAETEDPYWNAAMNEMLATGYMHNYMRMYWGKKILEWTNTPAYAFRTALYLNDKYFLDGRVENSYTNIGWVFGLHDRAWTERAVFGKVRYMNANGLRSKFDIDSYVEWASALTTDSRG